MGLKKLLKLIVSPQLSLTLMGVIALFLYLASEGNPVLYSPMFLGIILLFWCNLTFCTLRQFNNYRKVAQRPSDVNTGSNFKRNQAGIERMRGRLGSLLLHFGLLLVVSGALIQYSLGLKVLIPLSEGSTFVGQYEQNWTIRKGPLASSSIEGVKIFLQQIRIRPQTDQTEGEGLIVLVKNGKITEPRWLAKGQPVSSGLINMYYSNIGYVINAIYKANNGSTEVFSAKLNTVAGNNQEEYIGSFQRRDKGYIIDMKFLPDWEAGFSKELQQPRTSSYELRKPAVFIDLRLEGQKKGESLLRQVVPVGGQIKLPGGDQLLIENFVPWLGITVKKEPGLFVIYSGLVLAVLGMIILYVRRSGTM